ncbi:hypothetical protein [Dactylosporangium darangshiense]|uniref:Uncharacterized protein n=1 Tax=Dactylosporangium darangshiense TaxID=579108 RepID=A0ABP8DQD7_9ACTN
MLMAPTEQPLYVLSEQVAKLSGRDVQPLREELPAEPAGLDVAIRAVLVDGQ